MATFEAAIQTSLNDLCGDCPARNLCGQVELSRLEFSIGGETGVDECAVAVMEAQAASTIVLTSVFKNRYGCEGPQPLDHGGACECGNTMECPAFSMAVELINEE